MAPHLDGAQDRFAQPAARENVAQRSHRLVVAHVLIDRQAQSRLRHNSTHSFAAW